jgi:hypothetical protein
VHSRGVCTAKAGCDGLVPSRNAFRYPNVSDNNARDLLTGALARAQQQFVDDRIALEYPGSGSSSGEDSRCVGI